MNFLEGLKRLFAVFAFIIIAAAGWIAWSENGSPAGCIDESAIQWNPPAKSEDYSKLTDDELYSRLRKADAAKDVGQATELAKAIELRAKPWMKDPVVVPALRPLVICPPKMQVLIRQAAYAAAFAAGTSAVLFMIWLALRWIIVGFFPSAVRRT